jgi:hypothetical protein
MRPDQGGTPDAESPEPPDIRLLAFYLPQFHPIPENDAAWGEGFTEWTNVTRATPLFEGHHQPQLPTEMGFYDLRLPEVMARQAALAKAHGVHGFCYYAYWFDGRRLLEQPIEAMLRSGAPDMPFCLCWANENWTRRWDGSEHEVIVAQTFSPEYRLRIIDDFLPYFRDPRYVRVDGRAVFIVYRPDIVPDLRETLAAWRAHAAAAGVELYLVGCLTFGFSDPLRHGFDAGLEFPPHGVKAAGAADSVTWRRPFAGNAFRYDDVVQSEIAKPERPFPVFRSAMVGWDNTARRGDRAHIFLDATPEAFATWLSALVHRSRLLDPPGRRLVFVNAWNEWAEGAHLEPDNRFGRRWLQACAAALLPGGAMTPAAEAASLQGLAAAAATPGAAPILSLAHQMLQRAATARMAAEAAARAFAGHFAARLRADQQQQCRPLLRSDAQAEISLLPGPLDAVGWIDSPAEARRIADCRTPLHVSGWALHPVQGGVLPYPPILVMTPADDASPAWIAFTEYGRPRQDVEGNLPAPLPAAAACGFEAFLDLRAIPPGAWTLQVALAMPDGCAFLPTLRRLMVG